jgi:hypothetical protein
LTAAESDRCQQIEEALDIYSSPRVGLAAGDAEGSRIETGRVTLVGR